MIESPSAAMMAPTEAPASIAQLMMSRRFAPLFWCQFFSALSDNIVKNGLVFMILIRFAAQSGSLISLAGGLFILPFFLLSALGGDFADRLDKSHVAQRLKAAEIAIALIAGLGFVMDSTVVLFVALFGFGTISALFGPTKYGIIPDHMRKEEVPLANAAIEGSTFVAILAGTAIGALSGIGAASFGTHVFLAALIFGLSLTCYAISRAIPATERAAPDRVPDYNILRGTWRALRDLRADRLLWNFGLVTTAFWAMGTVVLTEMPIVVTQTLGGANLLVTVHLALFAIALAAGSFLAASFSKGRVLLLPAVLGAVLSAFGLADLAIVTVRAAPVTEQLGLLDYFSQPGTLRAAVDFALLALGGGLTIVPVFAALQTRAPAYERARIVAGANILNAAGMVLTAIVLGVLSAAGVSLGGIFGLTALAMLALAIWMIKALKIGIIRDLFAMIFRVVYRIDISGLENLDPAVCGVNPVIVVNHVSFLDAVIILSMLPRQPVFAIDSAIAKAWWLKPFVGPMRALPLDPGNPFVMRNLIAAVRAGDPLVIFPEGRITVTGSLMKIYDGTALVAEKTGAKVVPVRIAGAERTVFSRLTARQTEISWFPKIRVTLLTPTEVGVQPELRGKARRQAAGRVLYTIMSDLMYQTSVPTQTLFDAVARMARLYGGSSVALEDPISGKVTYARLLTGARALSAPFMGLAGHALSGGPLPAAEREEAVRTIGIMLPTSVGATVALLAAQSAGLTPAMINFTAGRDAIRSACTVAGVKTIVTSLAFIEKAKLQGLLDALSSDIKFVMLEDLRKGLSKFDLLKARLRCYEPRKRVAPNMPAVVLFTSGSEGLPKAVVLSHHNLLANVAQIAARIDFNRSDKVFNVLPVFHAFGLTGGLILPLISGVQSYLYPTPLHYRIIPELTYGTNATALFGTDTFLTGYAKMANPYDFRSLRFVVAGAEPVRDTTRKTYSEKFGVRILEGYGITETSPVLAVNTPMYNRAGTVGRILPEIQVRLEPVPGIEEGGRLFVKGPNVMMGYLTTEHPTVLQPPADGWHDTGDIVAIDGEGFVTIKGRAKRFAKIGGEMVSLARVDQLAAAVWPDAISGCVALPDARKGEKILCLTTQTGAERKALSEAAHAMGLNELAVPAEVVIVDALPLLGSGKIDFPALKALALRPKASEAGLGLVS
jgi:acyl-[acyl-carrier-protein]-phospholipid O-acyltransferase/long-chain-fatty-acid--[acyl-carrier-protein] ligase